MNLLLINPDELNWFGERPSFCVLYRLLPVATIDKIVKFRFKVKFGCTYCQCYCFLRGCLLGPSFWDFTSVMVIISLSWLTCCWWCHLPCWSFWGRSAFGCLVRCCPRGRWLTLRLGWRWQPLCYWYFLMIRPFVDFNNDKLFQIN